MNKDSQERIIEDQLNAWQNSYSKIIKQHENKNFKSFESIVLNHPACSLEVLQNLNFS